jgi:hypothetical protein
MNIYKINFFPLIIISAIFFVTKLLTYKLFNGSIVDIIATVIPFLYYFLIHPGLLLLWNFNYVGINKSTNIYKNIILIYISTFLGYALLFMGIFIFTGKLFSNNPDDYIIFYLIIPFDIIIILIAGIIETIKLGKNNE